MFLCFSFELGWRSELEDSVIWKELFVQKDAASVFSLWSEFSDQTRPKTPCFSFSSDVPLWHQIKVSHQETRDDENSRSVFKKASEQRRVTLKLFIFSFSQQNKRHPQSSEHFKVSKLNWSENLNKAFVHFWPHDTCCDVITSEWHLTVSLKKPEQLLSVPQSFCEVIGRLIRWPSSTHRAIMWPLIFQVCVEVLMSHMAGTNEEEACCDAAFTSHCTISWESLSRQKFFWKLRHIWLDTQWHRRVWKPGTHERIASAEGRRSVSSTEI